MYPTAYAASQFVSVYESQINYIVYHKNDLFYLRQRLRTTKIKTTYNTLKQKQNKKGRIHRKGKFHFVYLFLSSIFHNFEF